MNFLQRFLMFCLCLLSVAAGQAQSTAGWKSLSGNYFSFLYPPGWTATQPSKEEATVTGPGSVQFDILYTTAFGTDTNRLLAAEQAQLQQIASSNGISISFTGPEPSLRSGSAITAFSTTLAGTQA